MIAPIYDRDGITLYRGDCRDVLAQLEPGSIDAVVADPPYGDTSLDWDAPVREWLALTRPLLKPSASVWCFGSFRFFLSQAAELAGWQYAQDIVWEKHNGTNNANDRFRRVHELAVQLYPAGARWDAIYKLPQTTPDATKKVVRRKKRPAHWGEIGGHTYLSEDGGPRLMRSVIEVPSCHGHAVHPTQKPVGIVEPLVRYSVPPGGLVLDPFAGSGTTLADLPDIDVPVTMRPLRTPFFGRGVCPSCDRQNTSLFSGSDGPVCRDCLNNTDTPRGE